MDTRADFQRLLEDMDKVIQSKRQELLELDKRLEHSRTLLSEREAEELRNSEVPEDGNQQISKSIKEADRFIKEQQRLFDQQLSQLSEELNEIEAINQELGEENERLKKELMQSKSSTERFKAENLLLSETLDEVNKANLELNIRLAHAETETNMQQKLLKRSSDQDEILLAAFNDKIETMKKTIESKDEEIKRLKSENQFTLETLGITLDANTSESNKLQRSMTRSASVNSSNFINNQQNEVLIDSTVKEKIMQLAGALRAKDSQIELLKSQLLQATKDLENNANLLETLSKYHPGELKTSKGIDLSVTSISNDTEQLANKCEMLENELELKDKQVHLLEFRNRHFEVLLPKTIVNLMNKLVQSELLNNEKTIDYVDNLAKNLGNLLGEIGKTQRLLDNINQLRYECNARDVQIQRLVDELNRLYDAKYDHDETTEPDRLRDKSQDQSQLGNQKQIDKISEVQTCPQPGVSDGVEEHSNEQAESTRLPESEPSRADLQQSIKAAIVQEAPLVATATTNNAPAIATTTTTTTTTTSTTAATITNQGKNFSISNHSESEKDENLKSVSGSGRESERLIKEVAVVETDTKTKGPQLRSTLVSSTTTSSISIGDRRSQIYGRAKNEQQQQNIKTVTSTTRPAPIDHYHTLELQSRLRQLENENELLELAMKEILLSIKWSDAKCSTILIDCPSLERLCQLIEARFLTKSSSACTPNGTTVVGGLVSPVVGSSDQLEQQKHTENLTQLALERTPGSQSDLLFQFVILKSELDLLRGQNEQLRADIKFQRDEYRVLLLETTNANDNNSYITSTPARDINEPSRSKDDNESKDKIEICEVECQTETGVNNEEKDKCINCKRLTELMRHLLQCIANIESRFNKSEETYAHQLLSLYKLTMRLERELTICENFLSESRHQYHELKKQKMLDDSRILRTIPVNDQSHVPSLSNHEHSRHGRQPGQVHSSKMTISLLQSIIKCLQARIDYKDERLKQMESLLIETSSL